MRRFLALVLACLPACAGEAPPNSTAVVRDSAGIRIVENSSPSWEAGRAWQLGQQPEVSIGVAEGDSLYELFGVSSAVRLHDGRIAVANGGFEIRFFDRDGVYLTTLGRKGGGPGEFEGISWVRRFRGDSIVVYDSGLNRVSVFDSQGTFGRSATVQQTTGVPLPRVVGVFDDGSLLSRGGAHFAMGDIREGLARENARLLRHSPDGSDPEQIGVFPGMEVQYTEWRGRIGAGRPLFGRESYLATFGDRFYAGANDSYEIQMFTAAGELSAIIRRQYDVRITRADVDVLMERRLEQVEDPGMRREVRQAYADIPTGGPMPAFGWPGWAWGAIGRPADAIQVDGGGNLWVVDHGRPGEEQNSWTVFDSEGRMLGSIILPDGFRPVDIGERYVLGVWRDDLGVTYVQRYVLIKPEG